VVPVPLEEAGRDGHLQLRGERAHGDDTGVLRRWTGQREQRLILLAAEIGAGKQLGREDQLRALRSRILDQRGNGCDIGGFVIRAEGELEGGDRDGSHGPRPYSKARRGETSPPRRMRWITSPS